MILSYGINIIYIFIGNQLTTRFNRIHCPNNCGHSYTGVHCKRNLKRHLTFECGVEPQFQCYICSKRFTQKSNMKSHILLIHKLII